MDALTATLALLRLEALGPARYWQLLEQYHCPVSALHSLPAAVRSRLPARAQRQWADFREREADSELLRWVGDEIDRCAHAGARLIHHADDDYPGLLREIQRPPPVLYLRGDPAVLHLPQIAVVGARRATRAGLDNARAFSRELAAGGFAITSGLALGVDAAAHRGALDGGGVTLAVLGSGVDRLYPRGNGALAEEIIAGGGAVLSELPMHSAPEAGNFPRRNRIISGLSRGVLLVEAALRSGSLITARLALEQNREVFAIPGSIHNPMARGCHDLIKQGAALVETSADIVAQMGGVYIPATTTAPPGPPLTAEEEAIVTALGGDPRSLEQLAADTTAETGTLMATLLQMELAGLVEQVASGYQLTARGAAHLEAAG
ncbi:DNA-processing protein DprA [Microbulbifer yueqingensis]|uniref:DNA protecting protein DprA n=1 Tax=Microbulbifer yueqingensis TaxID=658219 RepID=A0A1G9BVT9_9GAMM|nr:DNA-processing protein DprA [Microbulbifer yueqingensis]SDK43549.1 DNA protecting protein DprA [Microbulbifer yueqingensis]